MTKNHDLLGLERISKTPLVDHEAKHGFTMLKKEIVASLYVKLPGNGKKSLFTIWRGGLVFNRTTPCKGAFLLEIVFLEQENRERKRKHLPPLRLHEREAFALEAHRLAKEYCSDNDFICVDHLCSWPTFQAIIRKAPTQ